VSDFPFSVTKGETFARAMTWWLVENVTPRNLTGYTMQMQVRDKVGGTVYADLSTTNGKIVIFDAPNGKFRATLTAAETGAIAAGTYRYDLKVTDAGASVSYPMRGSFIVRAPVTP
jgi:hypothetical protein